MVKIIIREDTDKEEDADLAMELDRELEQIAAEQESSKQSPETDKIEPEAVETPKSSAKEVDVDVIERLKKSPFGKHISPKSKTQKSKPEQHKVESLDIDLSDTIDIEDQTKFKQHEEDEELDSEFKETEEAAFQRAEIEPPTKGLSELQIDVDKLAPSQRGSFERLLNLLRAKGVITADQGIEDAMKLKINWNNWTQDEINDYNQLVYELSTRDHSWVETASQVAIDPYALSCIPINLWPNIRYGGEAGTPVSTVRNEVAKLLSNKWVDNKWQPGWFECMPGRSNHNKLIALYMITKDYYGKASDVHTKINYLNFLKYYHKNSTIPIIPWRQKKNINELIPSPDVTVRIFKMRDNTYKLIPEEIGLRIYSKWPEILAKYKKIISALGPEYNKLSADEAKKMVRENQEQITSQLGVSINDIDEAITWAKDPLYPMSNEPPISPVVGKGMATTFSGPVSFSKHGGKVPTAGDSRDNVRYLNKEYAINGLVNAITNLFSSPNFTSGNPDLIDISAITKLEVPIQFYKYKVSLNPEYSYLGNWSDTDLITLHRLFISALSSCNYDDEIDRIKGEINKLKETIDKLEDRSKMNELIEMIRNYEYQIKKLEKLKDNPPSPNLIEWYHNFNQGTDVSYATRIASPASKMPQAMQKVINNLKGFGQLYVYKYVGRVSKEIPKLVVHTVKDERGFGRYKYVGPLKDVVDLGVVGELNNIIKTINKAKETMQSEKNTASKSK